jgi:hypothetical protein
VGSSETALGAAGHTKQRTGLAVKKDDPDINRECGQKLTI